MSSHREAPEISKDPVADNTDVYAFVSPDSPKTVTLIANFVPLQDPPGGPNFFEFGDDVLYSIYIDNDGDGRPEISYVFRFKTTVSDPNTFLYNTGQILSLDSPNWNRRQFYSVARVDGRDTTTYGNGVAMPDSKVTSLGRNLPCPPCNIGPRSTPDYAASLGQPAVHTLPGGMKVFAGQRREGFFVDLGAIFDLGDLRPFQHLHLIPSADAMGVDATKTLNVHTIAIRCRSGSDRERVGPDGPDGLECGARRVGGGEPSQGADRRCSERQDARVRTVGAGLAPGQPAVQRGGRADGRQGPLERVLSRSTTLRSPAYVQHPELAKLLPVLYPDVFPNLAALHQSPRRPGGDPAHRDPWRDHSRVPELHRHGAGRPAAAERGDPADDVQPEPVWAARQRSRRVPERETGVRRRRQHRAAGDRGSRRIPLVDPSYTADAAAGVLTEGSTPAADRYQHGFPYLAAPLDGFDTPPQAR